MRVVIIHQYFKTPQEGGAIRSYYLAKGLLQYGHEVEVITAHNEKAADQSIEGINVHYLPVYYDNKLGVLSRITAFLKFVVLASRKAVKLPKADVNYVISTPLSIGLIALFLRSFRKTPYIFEIGDLWPEAPIQLGYVKNTILKKTLYWFEKQVYHNAKNIVAMSPDIERYVLKTQPAEKVIMIPNMADCDYFFPVEKPIGIAQKYGVEGKFVISYVGAAGRANHLEYLVEAAKVCNSKFPQVQFLVASAGRELLRIKRIIEKYNLTNISFIDYLDREGVKELLSVTDAVYVSFANVPILSSGSPNKLFDGLAAGKLVITNFEGWTKNVLEENQCGFSYNAEKPEELVMKLSPYLENKERLLSAKKNARALGEKSYSRDKLIEEWVGLFKC